LEPNLILTTYLIDLRSTLSTIRTVIQSLQQPRPLPSSPSIYTTILIFQPLTPGLPEILSNLLIIFRQTVTSFSLSIKPPLSIDPAISTLTKLSKEFAQIVTCVVAAPGGSAVEWEWRDGVLSLGEEVQRYLGVVLKELGEGGGEGYLVHTGMVWDALDRFGKPSSNETEAVVKRWEVQKAVVKDAWAEFGELLEEEADEGGELVFRENEEFEGIVGGGSLNSQERARAEAVSSSNFRSPAIQADLIRRNPC